MTSARRPPIRESFLEPRVDGHLEREARAPVAECAHRFGPLIQLRHDHQAREVLAVLVPADDRRTCVVRERDTSPRS